MGLIAQTTAPMHTAKDFRPMVTYPVRTGQMLVTHSPGIVIDDDGSGIVYLHEVSDEVVSDIKALREGVSEDLVSFDSCEKLFEYLRS